MKDLLPWAILIGIGYLVLKDRGDHAAGVVGDLPKNTGIMPPDQPAGNVLRGGNGNIGYGNTGFFPPTGDVLGGYPVQTGKGYGNADGAYNPNQSPPIIANPGGPLGKNAPAAVSAGGYAMGSGYR